MMITIENSYLRVVVDPSKGGRIDSLCALADGDEWIYRSEPKAAASASASVEYDDLWTGGFEELFPNDAPGEFEGRELPDHGEIWSAPLNVVERTERGLFMSTRCRTVPAQFEKRIHLEPDSARLSLRYDISHLGDVPFHYLFKLHAAMRIEPGDQLLLPGGRVTRVSEEFSQLMADSDGSSWPIVSALDDQTTDLSDIPARSPRGQEFVYVSELPEGWCGLRRSSTGRSFTMRYRLDDFPYCWLFMALGGWRGHYTIVLEPCTNIPKDLKVAKRSGTSAVLSPGDSRRYSVSIDVS